MNAWESRILRKVFRLHARDGELIVEGRWQTYYDRTNAIISNAKYVAKKPFLIHRMLYEYFREAWAEKKRKDKDGGNRTASLRTYRDRLWWDSRRDIPHSHRKLQGWIHSRTGPPCRQWEDLLVELRGAEWRKWRDGIKDEAEWKKNVEMRNGSDVWKLPRFPNRQTSLTETTQSI